MEGEDDSASSRQRIIQVNHEHRTKPTSSIEKSKYLNRMDEAFGTICSLISPELLFHISSCKNPMNPGPPWKGFLENRMR
jgi:hypothetical protein